MDYLFIKQSLGIKEIVQILENPPEKCITIPPRKPKAGQVFLFRGEDPTKEGNNTNATCNRIKPLIMRVWNHTVLNIYSA